VGTLIFILCKELLSSLWDHWAFAYGLSFVIVLCLLPTGIMGLWKKKKAPSNGPEPEKKLVVEIKDQLAQ
jgi:ABC-type branched-subunit amino acid transport system permease subunit